MKALGLARKVQVIGFASMAVACFAPALHTPVVGGASLWQQFIPGIVVLALAGAGFVVASVDVRNVPETLSVQLAGVLGVVFWGHWKLSHVPVPANLNGQPLPLGNLFEAIARNTHLGWAWIPLWLGCLACLAAPFIRFLPGGAPPARREPPARRPQAPAPGTSGPHRSASGAPAAPGRPPAGHARPASRLPPPRPAGRAGEA